MSYYNGGGGGGPTTFVNSIDFTVGLPVIMISLNVIGKKPILYFEF